MLGRNEAIKINDEEYEKILEISNYYNILGRCIGSDTCLHFTQSLTQTGEEGYVKVEITANTIHGFDRVEKIFQKHPEVQSSKDFINGIEAFMFEQLVKAYKEAIYFPSHYTLKEGEKEYDV